jgi:alpha-glucosidase
MIEQHLARLPNEIAHAQLNMLDSHDIHRLHLHREIFDWEIYRGIVMMQFLLPGTPNIWYGDEVGLGGHTRSTEGCRYPMQWDETRWDAGHRNLYRALARLKRDDAVLQRGAFQVLGADTEQLAVARVHLGERRAWLLLLNKGTTDTRVGVSLARIGPVGSVHELDESAPAGDRKRATDVAIHNGRMDVGLAARRSRLLELHSA